MKFFFVIFLAMICFDVQAESIKLATGEYAPYVGEHIPHNGISSMVVKAVLKEMKQEYSLEFMPWKRIVLELDIGSIFGSYPWNLNAERLKKNYFSMPINEYRMFVFSRSGDNFLTEKSLTGKILCMPAGWDLATTKDLVARTQLQVVSPASAESCFNMLARKRVDVIFMNHLVGKLMVEKIFGKNSIIVSNERPYLHKVVELHLIVSRKNTKGKKFIEDFNRGLEKIKSNGVYDSILSTISNYGPYNRLGLL